MRSFHSEQPILGNTAAKLLHAEQAPRLVRFRTRRVGVLDAPLHANFGYAARIIDAGVVFASGLGAHALVHPAGPVPVEHLFLVSFLSLLVVNLFQAARLYEGTGVQAGTRAIIAGLVIFMLCLVVVPAAATKLTGWTASSDAWLLRWGSLGFVALPAARLGLRGFAWWLAHDRRFGRRFLVVGDAEAAREVVDFLTDRGNVVVGVVSDRPVAAKMKASEQLEAEVRGKRVDDVVIALPWQDTRRMTEVMSVLRQFPVDVHLFPDRHNPVMSSHGVCLLGGVPLLHLSARPLGGARASPRRPRTSCWAAWHLSWPFP